MLILTCNSVAIQELLAGVSMSPLGLGKPGVVGTCTEKGGAWFSHCWEMEQPNRSGYVKGNSRDRRGRMVIKNEPTQALSSDLNSGRRCDLGRPSAMGSPCGSFRRAGGSI